ncbi:MAG: GNAT family N-acetyltransferase [Pseudomonadota bacterium]
MAEHTLLWQPQLPTLTRQVEEAAVNAWPAMQQMLLDGWLLRFSKGLSMRSNCVVPLYLSASPRDHTLIDRVRYCENLYAREQLQCVFRISATTQRQDMARLDRLLAERDYQRSQPSTIMTLALRNFAAPRNAVDVRLHSLQEWLQGYCELMEMPHPAQDLHRVILQSVGHDCAFALSHRDEQVLGCGLAIADHRVGGLFDIYCAPEARGQGIGRAITSHLLDWLAGRNLEHAYLHVLDSNTSAQALYAGLGFTPQYAFWYRHQ